MKSKSDPDLRLVQKAKSGNSIAFGKLVEKYQDRVLALMYDFTGDYNRARDIAQDVFVKVFVKISTFEERSGFATWLYRVAVNTCLDELKKSRKKSFRLFSDSGPVEKIEDPAAKAENQAADIELNLEKLSDQQRTAVILRFYNEMKIEEIAHIMECSDATVRTHIYRAIEKLKKNILK